MPNTEVAQDNSKSAAAALALEIKRRREQAGWSQPILAQRVGYTRQYVSRAENGRGLPSFDLVRAIDAAVNADGHLQALWNTAKAEHLARRAPQITPPAGDLTIATTNQLHQQPPNGQHVIGLETPAGRFFSGSALPALMVPAHLDHGRILTTPLDHPVLTRPQRGLVIAATRTGENTRYYGFDRRRARALLATANNAAPLMVPHAYVLDDFSLAILWAVTNLDDALLDDDTSLTQANDRMSAFTTTPHSTAAPDIAGDLSTVSQLWLGSDFCAHHILRHIDQLSQTPTFWSREQRGEEASTWLLFAHKYQYLQRTADLFAGTSTIPTRSFCIPADAVAASQRTERLLMLLTAALIESFGIHVAACTEPEYTATQGFVLDGRRRAIIATWINTDQLWHVDITDQRPMLTEFHDASGWAKAHSILTGTTPPHRLHQLADYLHLDWSWILRRSTDFADHGTAGLARPRSRLLSLAGLDRACTFLADLDRPTE